LNQLSSALSEVSGVSQRLSLLHLGLLTVGHQAEARSEIESKYTEQLGKLARSLEQAKGVLFFERAPDEARVRYSKKIQPLLQKAVELRELSLRLHVLVNEGEPIHSDLGAATGELAGHIAADSRRILSFITKDIVEAPIGAGNGFLYAVILLL